MKKFVFACCVSMRTLYNKSHLVAFSSKHICVYIISLIIVLMKSSIGFYITYLFTHPDTDL